MRYKAWFGAGILGAVLGVMPAGAAPQPPAQIDIAKVSCGDLEGASRLDRSAIVMFYWGYAAAKAGATTFKTGLLKSATAALMKECSKHDGETVLEAMKRIDVSAF